MSRSLHETLWQSCAAKRCCTVRTVLPTGADIARIAAHLHVPPHSFLRAIPASADAAGAFALDGTGARFQAALARRPHKNRPACVFLLQFGEAASRCGLGEGRPLPCQLFPAGGAPGVVTVDDEGACSCRAWSLADVDRAHISGLLRRSEQEAAQYRAVIEAWNARVGEGQREFREFGQYLLEAYTAGQAAP